MKVTVFLEFRFLRSPDGAVWTQTSFPRSFWDRYLDVFTSVEIAARVQDVPRPPASGHRVDGDRVAVVALPHYIGPEQFVRRYRALRRAVRRVAAEAEAVILRIPSALGAIAAREVVRRGRAYAVEVVGDPRDVFGVGSTTHPFRAFFRWYFVRNTARLCRQAAAAAYVTAAALQRRYPPGKQAATAHYSSIQLGAEAFASSARSYSSAPRPLRLVTVGTLEQLYKAPDVLIRAVAACRRRGVQTQLRIVGDGRRRADLERLARELEVADAVTFVGQLASGPAVREELDRADLFVLPSRQEGLPRALIEAMARGLPAIASSVGGIPELLPESDLVMAGDVDGLVHKLIEVAADSDRLSEMSRRNLSRAADYGDEVLRARRVQFYRRVADAVRVRHVAR